MFFASSVISGVLSLCAVTLLLMSPATASHSCLRGHNRRKGENSLQTNIDVSDSASARVITGYKKELSKALTKLHRNAAQLKKYIQRNHLTNELKKECKNSLSLRGLPQIKAEKVPKKEWVDVLTDDFRRLSIAVEFVSAAALDTSVYKQRLQNLTSDLQDCVCYLELLSNDNNLDLSHDITAAVVPRRYKNISQELLDRRNCLIVRDVHGLASDMKKMYAVKKSVKAT